MIIVSNHIPKEILEAKVILEESGIKVSILGQGYEHRMIRPDDIRRHSAVLTIGRTVQLSFAMGIPVYNYDRFGGEGWITRENFDSNFHYNFSGRPNKRKLSSIEILNEIKKGYPFAREATSAIQKLAREHFSMEKNVRKILKNVEKDTNNIAGSFQQNIDIATSRIFVREYKEKKELEEIIKRLERDKKLVLEEIIKIKKSKSWKVTAPLRWCIAQLKIAFVAFKKWMRCL